MKNYWICFGLLGSMLLSHMTSADTQNKWIIDNQHTYVRWEIDHLGFSTQTGKWYVDGFVLLDEKKPDNSRVEVSIDLAKLITGIPELDKHLQGKQFFDIKKFPKATFVSNKVEVIDQQHARVHGMLTLHGVAKPLELYVTLNKLGKSPIYDRMTAGFKATAHIKRSEFGMSTLTPQLGDDVTLEIGAEAYQPSEKKAS